MLGIEIELHDLTGTHASQRHRSVPFYVRISVIILACSLNIGHSYCSNMTSALQGVLMMNMRLSYFKYGLLNAISSLPNIFFIIISGYLTDYVIGIRKATMLFTSLVMLGNIIFILSSYIKNYDLMVLGRFLYGFGSESVFVCSSKYIALWYKDSTLIFVYSVQIGIIKAAQTLSFTISHPLYEYLLIFFPHEKSHIAMCITFFPALLATVISFMLSIFLSVIDVKNRENIIKREGFFDALKGTLDFPLLYWLNGIMSVLFFSAQHSFSNFSIDLLAKKGGFDPISANTIVSIGMIAGIIAAPIFGMFSAYVGLDLTMLIISSFAFMSSHLFLAFTKFTPLPVRILTSVTSVWASCIIWPLIPTIINTNDIGIAISIMMCLQHIGLSSFPQITGIIIENYGYFAFQILIIFLIAVSATIISSMFYVNKKQLDGRLNRTISIGSVI